MKSLKHLVGLAALGLAVPMAANAQYNLSGRLDFNPANACSGICSDSGGPGGYPSHISNSYGDIAAAGLDISYFSDLNPSGTGPVYYWSSVSSLSNVALGGDPDNGGGAGLMHFLVLPPATSVTLKSLDLGTFSVGDSGLTGGAATAYAASYSWWEVRRWADNELLGSGQSSAIGAVDHFDFNSGLGWNDPLGLVLKWGNSAGFATYTGVDNVQYEVASAVPENGTMGMLGAGLAVLAAASRRRKKAAA